MKIKTTLTTLAAITLLAVMPIFTLSRTNGQAAAPVALPTRFNFVSLSTVNVGNIEELYSAVNNPLNAGNLIIMAPGIYMLSANDPQNVPRPNGGRIDLLENMSLQGVAGDRAAVVIDAINLPPSSYEAPPIAKSGAIRMGRGSNSVEWLTIRNALDGNAGIETDILWPGTARIRIAHIISTGNTRGIDLRNLQPEEAGPVIEAEIVDNDLHSNSSAINTGTGLRIANGSNANGGSVTAILSNNRVYNNAYGLIVENINTSLGRLTVVSSGDRFYENGLGVNLGGGLSIGAGGTLANGNTTSFTAEGTLFENNNGSNPNDLGGMVIGGGATLTFANATSNNTVNVTLRNCRFGNNQLHDIEAIGALSRPESIGLTGTNNRVRIRLFNTRVPVMATADSIPASPGSMNGVAVVTNPRNSSFDYDGDGRADLSVFRQSDGIWYLKNSIFGFAAQQFGLSTDKPASADYDGDGITDIAVYRPSEGIWYIANSSNATYSSSRFGLSDDVPTASDFDGDGKADLSVFRPSNGTWYRLNSSNGQFAAIQWGQTGDVPMLGDHDADGKTDLTVFRPSNGVWYTYRSSDDQFRIEAFGLTGDIPLNGDFNGDGRADLAVFRPSDGTWYIARPTGIPGQNFDSMPFGLSTDIPVPADYDGDGRTDIAVYRNGTWYIVQSSNGSISYQQFGLSTDIPIAGANGQ